MFVLLFSMFSSSVFAERNPFFFQSYAPRHSYAVVSQNIDILPTQNTWIEDGRIKKMIFNGSISSEDQTVMLFSYSDKYYRLKIGEVAPNGMDVFGLDGQNVLLKNGEDIITVSPGQGL